jgi:cephalosporin hydroxylase
MFHAMVSKYLNRNGLFAQMPFKRLSRLRPPKPRTGPRPALLEVDKWALSPLVLHIARIINTHPYPLDELLLMAGAFEFHRPEIVIDIGTHMGKSARLWYEMSRILGQPAGIHTFDIQDPDHPEFPGASLGRYIKGYPVKQHIKDGYAGALEIVRAKPDGRYLVFLDGDHSFESVRRELGLARMLPKGSGILVHDTFYQPGSTYNHGPYLAIEEFRQEFDFRQVIHLQSGLPGMSYLAVG